MTDEKPTIFARNKRRRDARVKPIGDVRLSDETKELVIELVREGAMITEICERGIVPAYHYLWREMERDATFAAQYEAAKAKGAETLLQAAHEHALEMLESNDLDQIRAADAFMRITETYVEKIAPKQFGQLVKLAGDADAPLAIQVINYALPAAIPLKAVDVEARAITADEETTRTRTEIESGTVEGVKASGA